MVVNEWRSDIDFLHFQFFFQNREKQGREKQASYFEVRVGVVIHDMEIPLWGKRAVCSSEIFSFF